MCIVISSTVYGTRTFAALVKMVPGSKMFPAISVMILVAMLTLSVVSDGNAFSDGTRRMFPDMSSGVSVGIPLTVGAGWNRALADVNLNILIWKGITPFVEQIGDITDTFSNAVTLQSAIADDRAPPTLVSVVASSPSDIIVTFSEKISSKSTNIQNYDLSGATIRNTGLGVADGTVVISTGMFVRASISISNSTTIEDISNNTVQGGVTQSVIKN